MVPSLSFAYFIGGDRVDNDISRIRESGCNVVVGTVGRVFDLHQKNLINLGRLEVLIMDEADKLIDSGNEL